MLPRGKKEYDWEELPADHNNRRKEKAKPGSLGEKILLIGEEENLYSLYAPKISSNSSGLESQALLLQRMCMKNVSSVGSNFNNTSVNRFLRAYRKKNKPQTKPKAIVSTHHKKSM